jgi:pseudoazurin
MNKTIGGIAGILSLAGIAAAGAAEHEIKVLNQGQAGKMVFEPALLRVAAGDTVTFKMIDPHHFVASIRNMIPAAAQPLRGEASKDYKVTLTVPGIYGYECFVHIHTYGMAGVIVVGNDTSNLAAVRAALAQTPPRERERLDALLKQLGG